MPYPAGSIAVVDARLQDISGGMQWYMQGADDIRFLAVNGTLTVGASRARYDFTLHIPCTSMKHHGSFSPLSTMHLS